MHKDILSPEEDQLFDLLVVLIEKYEEEQNFIKTQSTPLERLRYLMEANNLKQADLASVFGSRGTTSEVLSGKREISKNAAIKLGERFRLPATFFMNS
ncbi:MAG: type II toxin-antitoxin system HigA family antitoxin [Cyanophyceae cyanobacterium]